MEFNITTTCRECGREFSTIKRYNDFIGQWELDSDSCEECTKIRSERIGKVSPMGN